MRQITTKYANDCARCGAHHPIGSQVVYERGAGIYCVACAPVDPEDIRAVRQEAADGKAARLEGWAATRRERAAAVFKSGERYRGDHAFNTQPGHIPERARLIRREDAAFKSLQKAGQMQARANGLRDNVRVAGDRERERQELRDVIRPRIAVGMRVRTGLYGDSVVIRINRKTATVEMDDSGHRVSVDLSWVIPLEVLPASSAPEARVASPPVPSGPAPTGT